MSAKASYGHFKVPNAIFDVGLSNSSFYVFAFLLRRANGNPHGQCWPGFRDIQKHTTIGSRHTIKKAIDELVKRGFVSIIGRTGTGCNIYRIHLDALELAARNSRAKEGEKEAPETVSRNTDLPQHSEGEVVQLLPVDGALIAPKVINMKKIKDKRSSPPVLQKTCKTQGEPPSPNSVLNDVSGIESKVVDEISISTKEKTPSQYRRAARCFYVEYFERGKTLNKNHPLYPSWRGFEQFWKEYPNYQKRNKKKAWIEWHRAVRVESRDDFERKRDFMTAIVRDMVNKRDHDAHWKTGYAPAPAKYLKGRVLAGRSRNRRELIWT